MSIKNHLLNEIGKMPEYRLHAIQHLLMRRNTQDDQWGPITSNLHPAARWVLIIEEEMDELKKEATDGDLVKITDELLDVIATAFSALEALEYLGSQDRAYEFNR